MLRLALVFRVQGVEFRVWRLWFRVHVSHLIGCSANAWECVVCLRLLPKVSSPDLMSKNNYYICTCHLQYHLHTCTTYCTLYALYNLHFWLAVCTALCCFFFATIVNLSRQGLDVRQQPLQYFIRNDPWFLQNCGLFWAKPAVFSPKPEMALFQSLLPGPHHQTICLMISE